MTPHNTKIPSRETQYPLRELPIPYRYSLSNLNLMGLSSSSNSNSLHSYETDSDMNKDNSDHDIQSIRPRSDMTPSVNDDIHGNISSNFDNIADNGNEKRSRSESDSESDNNPNNDHGLNIIKRMKLSGQVTDGIITDNIKSINPDFIQNTTAVNINNNNNNNTHSNNNNNATNNAILEDALPLSPIASSGLSTPGEKDINDMTMISQKDNINFMKFVECLDPLDLQRMAYRLVSRMDRSQLADLSVLIGDHLKKDFISSLPIEVAVNILTKLSFIDIIHATSVCSNWNKIIQNTPYLWKHLLMSERFISKEKFKKYQANLIKEYPLITKIEDIYKSDFYNRCHILKNWYNEKFKPQRTTLRGHMTSVVTCLEFEDDYIITGADDKMIRVYDSKKKKFFKELRGHDGGVWALKYDHDGIIVSGSTDRSVRVWDIKRGCCTHVFKGHTSTVRCLDIVEYENVKYIVTGSRDNTLHVWKLDQSLYNRDNIVQEEREGKWPLVYDTPTRNPFFVGVLKGHLASVRTVSGHGRIVISGSYDNTLMVWDIIKMKCLHIFAGHTDRIYSTIYDYKRKRCISASMDSLIKIWDLDDINKNGSHQVVSCAGSTCTRHMTSYKTLSGHSALVGLLRLSDKFLVSAAADGSLKGWDADNYSRQFTYHHDNLSAITTFCVNDNILVSGSEGQFHVYNLRNGELIHSHLLLDADQIWSVGFKNNLLVAAVEKNTQSYVEILDFSINEPVPTIRI